MGLVWSNDPESYAGGILANYHARQVKGDEPDKEEYPGPPCWWLGVGLTIPPYKNMRS